MIDIYVLQGVRLLMGLQQPRWNSKKNQILSFTPFDPIVDADIIEGGWKIWC